MSDTAPSDRASRDLMAALDQTRPRTAADAADPSVPVAGTVLLLRDGATGPEVLMIERPDRGSFAGAWVFPGGRLEESDADEDASEEDDARRAGVRETWEETGLVIAAPALQTVSCWDPPPGVPLRIRTWFFACAAPAGEISLSPGEAVAAEWARPDEMLARHGRGEVTLYPPTWVTLHGLIGSEDVGAFLDGVRLRGAARFETVVRRTPAGPLFLWQDDAAYDDAAEDKASGPRHRLETGRLPWSYVRSA